MTTATFLPEFWSPYEQFRWHNGKSFVVLGQVSHATHPKAVDKRVGHLWHIRLQDGNEVWAWPEEVEVQV